MIYSFRRFKRWLEEDPARKAGLDQWENLFTVQRQPNFSDDIIVKAIKNPTDNRREERERLKPYEQEVRNWMQDKEVVFKECVRCEGEDLMYNYASDVLCGHCEDSFSRNPSSYYSEVLDEKKVLEQQKSELQTQLSSQTTELHQELTKTQQLQQNLTNLQTQKQTNETNLKQQIKNQESELQKLLTESKESTATLRQEIEELKKTLQESKEVSKKDLESEQKKLKNVETKLNEQIIINQQKEQTIEQLKTNLAESEKTLKDTKQSLTQTQQTITQLETQVLNYEQLKGRYEERIEELQKELSQSQASNQELSKEKEKVSQELTQTKETLQSKQETLKEERLKVVSLQSQLKRVSKPEPVKPSLSETQPLNPWMLGVILVVGVGLFLLLNRRRE